MSQHRGVTFRLRESLFGLTWVGFAAFAASPALADDIAVETVVTDLHYPSGIAIRPNTGADSHEIYVADAGAGRIVRLQNTNSAISKEAITGFASKPDSDAPFGPPGPRGLLFLDRTRLVVTGSDGDGRAFVRLYELSEQEKPLAAEQYEQNIEPPADGERSGAGVESFHSLARTFANDHVPDLLVIAAIRKDGSAPPWKIPVRAGTLGELELFGSTQPGAQASKPTAIAAAPRGHILISQPSTDDDSQAGRLKFVNPIDGRIALEVAVQLQEIVGLAYSPRTGNLYTIDFASRDPKRGGVYRIDAGEPGQPATPVLVGEVRRPTALAFGADGALYVTALGELDDGGSNRGVLLKLTGEL